MIGGRSTVAAVGLSDQTWHLNLACSAFTLASPQHRRHRAVIIIRIRIFVVVHWAHWIGPTRAAGGAVWPNSACLLARSNWSASSEVHPCPGLPLPFFLLSLLSHNGRIATGRAVGYAQREDDVPVALKRPRQSCRRDRSRCGDGGHARGGHTMATGVRASLIAKPIV